VIDETCFNSVYQKYQKNTTKIKKKYKKKSTKKMKMAGALLIMDGSGISGFVESL
jgi:hypothetical protein